MARRNRNTALILVLLLIALVSGVLFTRQARAPGAQRSNQTVNSTTGAEGTASSTPSFNKTQFSVDSPDSPWVVVNKTRPLNPISYAPADLTSVGGGQQLRKEAAEAFMAMQAAAKNEGLSLAAMSGYRSYETQVSVYNSEVKSNGQAVADTQSARPGTSEHQTGWALDVGGGGCGIEDCFGTTAEGKWVAAHAYEYGFIIRYISAKQAVTGYRAEPWHLRYIGPLLSTEMHQKDITTLEEFFSLPAAPDYPK